MQNDKPQTPEPDTHHQWVALHAEEPYATWMEEEWLRQPGHDEEDYHRRRREIALRGWLVVQS